MPGENLDTGDKGKVIKIGQQPSSNSEFDYLYEMEWYDDDGKIISELSLLPQSDTWMLDPEYDTNEGINESRINNIEQLVELGEFLSLFKRSDLNTICEMLELERRSGFSNMYTEGGRFLLSGPDYIKDFIKLQSYGKEFSEEDEEVFEAMISRAQEVRDIFIRSAIKFLENQGKEIEIPKVQNTMIRLARTAKKYWLDNANKFLTKEIK
jgi:phosphoenolpyruvate synthase/pyruvate phosphate dikinase